MLSRRKSNLWESLLPPKETTATNDTESQDVVIHRNLTFQERNHVTGVLSIKIKHVKIDSGALSPLEIVAQQSIYCSIQVRNFTSRTKIARNSKAGRVGFLQTKHFPVNVVGNRSHPFNLVKIEVFGCGSNGPEIPLGGVLFHVHDLIRGSPASGDFPLSGANLVIGTIGLDLTFNYGIFGYGVSQQLADEDCTTEDAIQYSLLPRINPDPSACEPNDIILKTQAVPHPNFIPFERKVFLSYGKDLEGQLEDLGARMEERTCFRGQGTEKVQKTYYSIPDRATRLQYLHDWLQESHCRQESVPEPPTEYHSPDFPKKAYIRFLTPIIPEEAEPEMPKFLEMLEGKGKKKEDPNPKIKQSKQIDSPLRPDIPQETLWSRLKQMIWVQ